MVRTFKAPWRDPPFVADPEFAPLDLDALEGKGTRPAARRPETPASIVLRMDQAKFLFLLWLLELILLPLLVLMILG